jgi:hypothetical protein
MVVMSSFTHLSVTFSNQGFSNCSPTVDVEFVKLMLDSFCGNRGFKMNIQFCWPVTCAAVVLIFFETLLLNVRRSLSVTVNFRPLFLFTDVVIPWFMYADITLESVALDTPYNLTVFFFLSQMLQLNAFQRSVLFQNGTSLLFSDSFTRTVTLHNH